MIEIRSLEFGYPGGEFHLSIPELNVVGRRETRRYRPQRLGQDHPPEPGGGHHHPAEGKGAGSRFGSEHAQRRGAARLPHYSHRLCVPGLRAARLSQRSGQHPPPIPHLRRPGAQLAKCETVPRSWPCRWGSATS